MKRPLLALSLLTTTLLCTPARSQGLGYPGNAYAPVPTGQSSAIQSVLGTVTVNPQGYGAGTDVSNAAPLALTSLATFIVSNPGAYFVQNQSAAAIQVQLCTSVGTNCTIQLLAPGSGANTQGGDTNPPIAWFTGYVAIYGASGSQFAARHN